MSSPQDDAKAVVREVSKDPDTVRDMIWAISKVERKIGRSMTSDDMAALFSEMKAPAIEGIRLVLDREA